LWVHYRHVGHFIACYQRDPAVVIAYLTLLNGLMKTQPEAVIELLQQQDKDGWHVGHFIACHQTDPAVTIAYLTLLNSLIKTESEVVVTLLHQHNKDDSHVGHFIAYFQTGPAVAVAYLTLLNSLMKTEPEAVLTLLQKYNKYNWSVGHLIAYLQTDPAAATAYLAFLTRLMETQQEGAIALLQLQDKNGRHVGHYIAHFQIDSAVTKTYLALLTHLMTTQPKAVVALLQQLDRNGWNVGHFIAYYQQKALEDYLKLLSNLMPQALEIIFSLLTQKLVRSDDPEVELRIDSTGIDIGGLIEKEASLKIYHALYLNAFITLLDNTHPVCIEHYLPHVTKVTDLLLALPAEDPKTLPLLKRCTNKDSALGKYFHTSTNNKIKLIDREVDIEFHQLVQTPVSINANAISSVSSTSHLTTANSHTSASFDKSECEMNAFEKDFP